MSVEPAGEAPDQELPELREFVVRLGAGMVASGDSIDSVHRTLHRAG